MLNTGENMSNEVTIQRFVYQKFINAVENFQFKRYCNRNEKCVE